MFVVSFFFPFDICSNLGKIYSYPEGRRGDTLATDVGSNNQHGNNAVHYNCA